LRCEEDTEQKLLLETDSDNEISSNSDKGTDTNINICIDSGDDENSVSTTQLDIYTEYECIIGKGWAKCNTDNSYTCDSKKYN
jgi:hypothetical protein